MTKTSYKCPVCQGTLSLSFGDCFHPNDERYGVYVYCPHLKCEAQEVMGHGKNEKDAFQVVTDKFKVKAS